MCRCLKPALLTGPCRCLKPVWGFGADKRRDPAANYSGSRSFYAKWAKQPVATYTFEAEGCDLSGMTSFGYSINVSETDMILGSSNAMPENVKSSLSNGYFIGYFQTQNEDGLTLKFPIDADKASTATGSR